MAKRPKCKTKYYKTLIGILPNTIYKDNLKMDYRLDIRLDTIKLLGGKHRQNSL